ncbi:MAG: AraC-like DNA-binding protein [Woeseiaceae bacterium]|jgi:AraC-like DNA-binding protein
MQRAKLIWFDMTITTRHAEQGRKFRKHFDIHYSSSPNHPEDNLESVPGAAACFEFDYPDRPGLSDLCRAKERYPHVPMLMLTSQHSEQLAVWAYRNRVLDYLVKPVSEEDLVRCKDLILAIQNAGDRQDNRRIIEYKSNFPTEIPAGQRDRGLRLAPALNFVQKNFRSKIRNSEVARACGMSPFHFSHEFAETYSLTFQEFVLRYRILEACKELQHPNIPVTNVAYSVGFNDPSYFARVFRRFIDLSPSEYCEQVSRGEVSQRISDIVARLELPEFESVKMVRRREDIESQNLERRRRSEL